MVVARHATGAVPAVGFYLAAYLLMNLGAFLVVAQLERAVGVAAVNGIRGLARSSLWPAAAITVCLLWLAGIAPLAGFRRKCFPTLRRDRGGMAWLAAIAAAYMAIGLFYYARIVALMYFEAPAHERRIADGAGYVAGPSCAYSARSCRGSCRVP